MVLGFLTSMIQGCMQPFIAALMAKTLFVFMLTNSDQIREEANKWCLLMFIVAISSFIATFSSKFSFGIVGENVTLKMRASLY